MWRRVIRMLVVYVFWSAVYSAYNVYVLDKVYGPTKIKTFIDGCFSGELHMWYIPMTTGLYIASPILAVLVKKLEKKWTAYWLLGMFLFSSVIPFLIKLDIKFVSTVIGSVNGYMDLQFLGGWTLYFVLGYYIRQHSFSKKEKLAVYTLALAALAFTFERTVLYCLRNGEPFGILSYEYPNIYFISIGVMVFFKEEVSRIRMSASAMCAIETVSKLTFGVYLMHVLLLRIFYQSGLNLQFAPNVVSVPIVSFVVLITGGIISAILKRLPFVGKYIL
jgi:surface polysaccharide O-acyltransferase-like enzyme